MSPGEHYYVRLFAENEVGEGRNGLREPIATEKQDLGSFNTSGAPFATTLAVHGFDGETLRVVGSVNPDSVPTSSEQIVTVKGAPTGGTFTLTFKGQTTAPITYDAPAEDAGSVRSALEALSTIGGDGGEVRVGGPNGGPYRIYFLVRDGEMEQPALSGDGFPSRRRSPRKAKIPSRTSKTFSGNAASCSWPALGPGTISTCPAPASRARSCSQVSQIRERPGAAGVHGPSRENDRGRSRPLCGKSARGNCFGCVKTHGGHACEACPSSWKRILFLAAPVRLLPSSAASTRTCKTRKPRGTRCCRAGQPAWRPRWRERQRPATRAEPTGPRYGRRPASRARKRTRGSGGARSAPRSAALGWRCSPNCPFPPPGRS